MATVNAESSNLLIKGLGPLMDRAALGHALTYRPPPVGDLAKLSTPERLQRIRLLAALHLPQSVEIQLASRMLQAVHTGYLLRDPHKAETWKTVYSRDGNTLNVPPESILVTGISGTGKTVALDAILSTLPTVVYHTSFPRMSTALRQIVWIKIDAPGSGRQRDLAWNLLDALAERLGPSVLDDLERFKSAPTLLLRRALQIAKTHFLGLLVVDEVQNLFCLSSVEERRRLSSRMPTRAPLRLVEDETLKFLLNVSNTSGIPIVLSGTPDVLRGLQTRLAVLFRLARGGHFVLTRAPSSSDPFFSRILLPQLHRYQWLDSPIELSQELGEVLYSLTAGIPRLYVALWQAAQELALERGRSELKMSDIHLAAKSQMALVRPAIAALLSDDPLQLLPFEDLGPNELPQ